MINVKKKSKKGVIPRQEKTQKPSKVGGRNEASGRVNWSRVGRRRHEENDAIQKLGQKFRDLREKEEISVTELARKLNVAPATLIKFEEKGYPVSIKIVLMMADQLGYTLDVKPGNSSGKKK